MEFWTIASLEIMIVFNVFYHHVFKKNQILTESVVPIWSTSLLVLSADTESINTAQIAGI